MENSTVADQLFNDVKILCWIMTNPSNHQKKAKHVMKTWGSRCNKLLFMSSARGLLDFDTQTRYGQTLPLISKKKKKNYPLRLDDEINAIPLPVKEGRNNLWAKTKESFKYIYDNHLYDYDWFLKADDDTYVIVENLRYMLYPYAAETPIYFGCRFKPFVKQVTSLVVPCLL